MLQFKSYQIPLLFRGFFIIFCLISGCTNDTTYKNTYSSMAYIANNSFKKIDYKKAEKLPYASIGINLNGTQGYLVLAYAIGPERQWFSSDHLVITTQNGLLKRTFGLRENLVDLRYTLGFNPFKNSLKLVKRNSIANGTLSLSPEQVYQVPFQSAFTYAGKTKFKSLLGKMRQAAIIYQQVNVPQLNWEFTNTYWISTKSGRVLKCIQHYAPNKQMMIETINPFTKDLP